MTDQIVLVIRTVRFSGQQNHLRTVTFVT
jgi:hypothetical protein